MSLDKTVFHVKRVFRRSAPFSTKSGAAVCPPFKPGRTPFTVPTTHHGIPPHLCRRQTQTPPLQRTGSREEVPSLATLITPQNMEEDAGDEGKEAEADRVNSATDSESVEEMILRKYEFCQKLGKGAFGVVWKVIYKMSRKPAALKKVFHAWRTRRDAQRMYREITYLQALRGHDNIVDMRRMYVCAPPAVEGGPSRLP